MMFSNFDWNVILRSLPYLFFDGMRFTIMLTLMATAGGVVIGTLLAMARLSPRGMAVSATAGGLRAGSKHGKPRGKARDESEAYFGRDTSSIIRPSSSSGATDLARS